MQHATLSGRRIYVEGRIFDTLNIALLHRVGELVWEPNLGRYLPTDLTVLNRYQQLISAERCRSRGLADYHAVVLVEANDTDCSVKVFPSEFGAGRRIDYGYLVLVRPVICNQHELTTVNIEGSEPRLFFDRGDLS